MLPRLLKRLHDWNEGRQQRRTTRLTALAADLDPAKEHDLLLLQNRGFVLARATGQSITQIHAEIKNLVNQRLRVSISPGTYFVAMGNHQNMVRRERYTVALNPRSTQKVAIDASCINARRPVPQNSSSFQGVSRVTDDLARFLEASSGSDPMTVQSGVWALTDNYTGEQVKSHLLARDRWGNTRPAVADSNIRAATKILNTLGIRNKL